MPRSRLPLVVSFALLLISVGPVGMATHVQAQEATPVVELSTTPPVQPGGTLPGNPQIQLVQVAVSPIR